MLAVLLVTLARVSSGRNKAPTTLTSARSPGLHAAARWSEGSVRKGSTSRGRQTPRPPAAVMGGGGGGALRAMPSAGEPELSGSQAAAAPTGPKPASKPPPLVHAGTGGLALSGLASVASGKDSAHHRNEYMKKFHGGLGAMTVKELGIKPGQSHEPRLRECPTPIGIHQKYHISKRLGKKHRSHAAHP